MRSLLFTATLLAAGAAQAAVPLPQLNIDKTNITVSGLSSGGFMANQLGYAHSATFKGVGVFAAGPYMCAGHNSYSSCMNNNSVSASQLTTMQNSINSWSGSQIDAKANVAGQKAFLFVGSSDTTVGPNPLAAARTQYTNNGVTTANLQFVQRASTAHTFPTDFDSTGNNGCNSTASPYISNCGYDGAQAVLSHFYGTLNARNNAPAAGNYVEYNQAAFHSNPGMAATGWAYVPSDCATGQQCKLHVALHGCLQSTANVGDKFVKNTGYSRWADTNRIVVLFPQTKVDNTLRQTAASGSLPNPNACWDWVGWYGSNFAQRGGAQITALKAMVDHVSNGSGGGGTLPAPANVSTSGATANSMAINWSAVNGAAGYNVYRAATRRNATPITGTSYTDTGLASGTAYSWTVRAVDANGAEGASSAAAAGTTTGTPPPAATCFTASNYAHSIAGRAYAFYGITYANGSNQNMGLWNIYATTTLKQTGTNYYVIGTCP